MIRLHLVVYQKSTLSCSNMSILIPVLLFCILVPSFGQDSAITFPDQEPRLPKQMLPKLRHETLAEQRTQKLIPRGCSNEDEFCEEPLDYPDLKFLRKLLKNETSGAKAILFGKSKPQFQSRMRMEDHLFEKDNHVEADVRSISTTEDRAILGQAAGISTDTDYVDLIEESPICEFSESFVYPRTARNLDNKWRFVINVPRGEEGDEEEDEYVQAVRVERCLRQGRSCNIDSVSGVETVCRQKYSLRRLLALSQEGYQYVDVFKFPSCCVCYQKRDLTLGIPIQTSDTQIDLRDQDSKNHSWW